MSINTEPRPAMAGLIALLGTEVARFEATVFHVASQLTTDHLEEGVTRYLGGNWTLEAIAQEESTSYWWRLDSNVRFRYLNTMNGCEETVDAELLSMAINLISMSRLCIGHFQRGNERLNHAYAVLHDGLRQYCLSYLQADEPRLRQLLAMID